jgi:hypothetical protein
MALVLNDRVKETSTTTGQGTLSLGGAATGFETFVTGIGNSNTTYYLAAHESDGTWELGIGTVTDASPDTLARTTVIDTSAGNTTKIDFASGSKTIFCTLPAGKAVFLDADGDVTLGANLSVGGNLDVTGTFDLSDSNFTNAGDIQLDSITGDGDTNTKITFSGSDVITVTAGGDDQVTFTNGAIVPSTDNDIDLGTSSVEFKDAFFDGTVTSDAFAGPLTGDVTGNVSGTAATVTGAAQSNITSLGTLTTLTVDNVIINGSTIGHTGDTDLMTVASGVLTVAGEISVTTLDIGGTNVTSTAAELNILDGVTSTAAELNILDGVTSTAAELNILDGVTSTAAELNALDGITAVVGELNALDLGSTAVGTAIASKAVILDSNKDYTGIRNLTITGELDGATLDLSGDADIAGTTNLDNTDIDGTLVVDGSNISLDSTSTLNIDNSNTSNGVTIGTATSGVPISIGHSTSEVTVNDNLTVTGNFTVSGTSTTVDSTTVAVADSMFKLAKDQGTSADALDFGFYGQYGVGGTAKFAGVFRDVSATGDPFTFFDDLQAEPGTTVNTSGTGYDLADIAAGGATFADNVTITGDADVDGTLEADAITVNGTALNTVIAGVTVTNATTAAVATTVTISDNESTNEDNAIIFTAGGDVDGGNIGLESDGDLIYNPSTGRLTATQLAGTLQTAAQANITSLGTLTTLTVDNVIINGSTIGHTGDTDLMTVASGVLTVAGEVSMTTLDIGGTNVAATAAELNIMDGGTSATGTTLADADRVVVNDNGTMKQVAMTDISTYTDGGATALAIALG